MVQPNLKYEVWLVWCMKMKNKKSKKLKTISFDEEIVSKHAAEEILSKNENSSETQKHKKKKKRKLKLQEDITEDETKNHSEKHTEDSNEDNNSPPKSKKKKKHPDPTVSQEENEELPRRKKKNKKQTVEEENNEETKTESKDEEKDNGEPINPSEKKKESIRALRRKRHLKLLEEKKIKSELQMQQKSLNYLSKWKHSREEWKFEKLRQIWLQHNMYDSAKIPEEFWGVLIEYFSNSKGKIREIILKDAIKLIDESPEDDENQIKVQRARDIVQNLQE